MLPRRDDARKKLCCPSNFGALFIGLQVVFFLNCDLEMYNQRLSINASVCDWLILLTSAVSEMKQEGGSMEEGLYYQLWLGEKRNCIWASQVCISLWVEFQKYLFMLYWHFFKKTVNAMIAIVVTIIFEQVL